MVESKCKESIEQSHQIQKQATNHRIRKSECTRIVFPVYPLHLKPKKKKGVTSTIKIAKEHSLTLHIVTQNVFFWATQSNNA
jgi:hypothetical protein